MWKRLFLYFSLNEQQTFVVWCIALFPLFTVFSCFVNANHHLLTDESIIFPEAKSVATTYDCKYIETSVVLNHNVDELLVGIVSQIRLNDTMPKKGHHSEPSCYARSKNLLHKIFRKDHMSKSCENLYVL